MSSSLSSTAPSLGVLPSTLAPARRCARRHMRHNRPRPSDDSVVVDDDHNEEDVGDIAEVDVDDLTSERATSRATPSKANDNAGPTAANAFERHRV